DHPGQRFGHQLDPRTAHVLPVAAGQALDRQPVVDRRRRPAVERAQRGVPAGAPALPSDPGADRGLGLPLRVPGLGDPRRSGASGRMKDLIGNPWLRLVGLLAALAGLFLLLRALRHVLTPFGVAFALAYFLNPAVN